MGPFTPYIADEAWSFLQSNQEYGHDFLCLQKWPVPIDLGTYSEAVAQIQTLLDFKDLKVNEALEQLRVKKEIGQSLDAEVKIEVPAQSEVCSALEFCTPDELSELFIVSSVSLSIMDTNQEIQVEAKHASGVRCPRSWRWVPELVRVEPWGEVSPRCADVLANLR